MGEKHDNLALGIDLGGTKILTTVADTQGKMLSRDHSITPVKEGQEAVIKSILESITKSLDQAQIAAAEVRHKAGGLAQRRVVDDQKEHTDGDGRQQSLRRPHDRHQVPFHQQEDLVEEGLPAATSVRCQRCLTHLGSHFSYTSPTNRITVQDANA